MGKSQYIKKTLKRLSMAVLCVALTFTISGCFKQKTTYIDPTATMTPEEKAIYERDFTKNAWTKTLNETYPGKTFVVEDVEAINDPMNPAYGMNTVKITCVDDGITFMGTPTTGVEEYQEKVWDKELKSDLNVKLKEMYGDDYVIDDSFTEFMAYGYLNDTEEASDDDDWYWSTHDGISQRYLNTSYKEAVTILSKQEVVDPSRTKISFYVFTDAVDKEKEMDKIRELHKQFILPIKDEILIVENNEGSRSEHKRGYLIEIVYLDPLKKENIYRFETTDYSNIDRDTYDKDYEKYVESQKNDLLYFSISDKSFSEILTKEDLTNEYLSKHFYE